MKPLKVLGYSWVLLLFLASCSSGKDILLVLDPYIFRDKSGFVSIEAFSKPFKDQGYRVRIHPVNPSQGAPDAFQKLGKILEENPKIPVVLSGLYSGALFQEIRRQSADRTVILLQGPPSQVDAHTWVLNHDSKGKAAAFGTLVGLFSRLYPGTGTLKLGGVVYSGTPERQDFWQQVQKGFQSVLDPPQYTFQQTQRLRETENFRTLTSLVTGVNPPVYLGAASVMNPAFLDQVPEAPVFLDFYFPPQDKAHRVPAFLEYDWLQMAQAAATLGPGPPSEVKIPVKLVINPGFKISLQKSP